MFSRKTRYALLAMAGMQICTIAPAMAQSSSGDIVMRRPLPRSVGGDAGTTTPTTPPTTSDPTEVDPFAVCDGAEGSPAPILTNVSWVEAGWEVGPVDSSNGCVVQKMTYSCQATFACQVGGSNDGFTSVAPDSVCENFNGQVSVPPPIGDDTSGGGGGGGNGDVPAGLCEESGPMGPRYRVCGDFDPSILEGYGCVINGYVEFFDACGIPSPPSLPPLS